MKLRAMFATVIFLVSLCPCCVQAEEKEKAATAVVPVDLLKDFEKICLIEVDAKAVAKLCNGLETTLLKMRQTRQDIAKTNPALAVRLAVLETAISLEITKVQIQLELKYMHELIDTPLDEKNLVAFDRKYRWRVQRAKDGQWKVMEK